jgi:S-DNA-T family DNA segregation ATPase FtsK/SpoIIIE
MDTPDKKKPRAVKKARARSSAPGKAAKKPAGEPAVDRQAREISGIALICFGVLSAIALFAKAPLLTQLMSGYRLVLGYGAFVLPAILALTGLYIIVRKKRVLWATIHLTLGSLWLLCVVHLLKYSRNMDSCMDRGSLSDGGGFISALPACVLNQFMGPAGGVLVLNAIALIYLKITTKISYGAILEKCGTAAAPVLSKMGRGARAGFTVVGARVADMKQTMSENRRDRLEALRMERERQAEQKEREAEERARKLMEEIQKFPQSAISEDETECAAARIQPVEPAPEPEPQAPAHEPERAYQPEPEPDEDPGQKQIPFPVLQDASCDMDEGFLEDNEDDESGDDQDAAEEQPVIDEVTARAASPVNPYIDADVEEVAVATEDAVEKIQWRLPNPDEWLDPYDASLAGRVDSSLRDRLNATLKNFSVPATITNVVQGASSTRFEVTLEPGVKVSRIVSLENDIALALASDSKLIRIEAPIPGKSAVGIEVPNRERAVVPMRKLFLSNEFQRNARGVLTFVLGENITGEPVWANLMKMPHLLVAGSTNSGKSVCLNCIVTSILARNYPEDVRFIMMDMKRVELTPYNGIPHLLTEVVTEPDVAASALKWITEEMDRRYRTFAEVGVRNIDGYNKLQESHEDMLYRIVVIIDELADLMMVSSPSMNVELHICRIAQLARAVGIHMILATQRPDTKVITGTIKNNIPSRISFAVPTNVDSRTILDQKGAESLLGRGDMLYSPVDSTRLMRLQGAFVSDAECHRLVDFWKSQGVVKPELRFKGPEANIVSESEFVSEDEDLYSKAVEVVVSSNQASISMIQRKLRIGYNRAARLVELMEDRGVVGPYDGSKPREVLLTRTGFESREF